MIISLEESIDELVKEFGLDINYDVDRCWLAGYMRAQWDQMRPSDMAERHRLMCLELNIPEHQKEWAKSVSTLVDNFPFDELDNLNDIVEYVVKAYSYPRNEAEDSKIINDLQKILDAYHALKITGKFKVIEIFYRVGGQFKRQSQKSLIRIGKKDFSMKHGKPIN